MAQQILRIPWVYDGLRMPLIRKGERGQPPQGAITVETNLFNHREVKPHFINPCCLGEDFAAWLKQELSRSLNTSFELSEAIQEDFGWGFWASHGKDRFWIALSYVGDGPQEPPAQWLVSVHDERGFNLAKRLFHRTDHEAFEQLRERIRQILISNAAIKIVQ